VTRAFVIGRLEKGRKNGRLVREVEDALKAGGWTTDSLLVSKKRGIRRTSASSEAAGYDVVVAVGGDDAVVQAAAGVGRSRVALGIVPTGNGDLLAGNLGIPARPSDAARVILTGRKRVIDLGRASIEGKRRSFAVACGVSYDATVDTTDKAKRLPWGKAAYLANALRQIGDVRNVPHQLTLDGQTRIVDASQIFIANFGKLLPVIRPRQSVRPDDGRLDVIVVSASGLIPGLLANWEVVRQKQLGISGGGHVFRARASEISVETPSPRLVESDGRIIGTTPLNVRVKPRALAVLVPRR